MAEFNSLTYYGLVTIVAVNYQSEHHPAPRPQQTDERNL